MNVKLPKDDIKSKNTHIVAKPVPKSKVCSKPPSSSTLRLREYFSQFAANTNFGDKGGRGENARVITPTGCFFSPIKSNMLIWKGYFHPRNY